MHLVAAASPQSGMVERYLVFGCTPFHLYRAALVHETGFGMGYFRSIAQLPNDTIRSTLKSSTGIGRIW